MEQLKLKVGQALLIQVENNVSSGYTVNLSLSSPSVVSITEQDREPENSAMSPGDTAILSFIILALKEGSVRVEFSESRIWEDDDPIILRQFQIQVEP